MKPIERKARPRGVQSRNPKPYPIRPKAAGALVCGTCGLVRHGGRWYRGAPPTTALHAGLCPACERIRDRYPAGTLRLHPAFVEHRAEIVHMIENVERAEQAEHPLERLMGVCEDEGRLVITTTGIHLARQIAHALARRFHQRARSDPLYGRRGPRARRLGVAALEATSTVDAAFRGARDRAPAVARRIASCAPSSSSLRTAHWAPRHERDGSPLAPSLSWASPAP
jgi:hypothetical protein